MQKLVKKLTGNVNELEETFTKLDQHVNEMMTTAGKKFQNFLWSRFLIIVQNVNMVVNGKCNSRLNPNTYKSYRYIPFIVCLFVYRIHLFSQ